MTEILIIIICLCLSISIGAGIYFVTKESSASSTTPTTSTTSTSPTTPTTSINFIPFTEDDTLNSSPWNDAGNGNFVFLDRHNVDCSDKAINNLHLVSKDENKSYHYEFKCSSGGSLSKPIDKSTEFNEDGGGNTMYLDRHNIDCGKNKVLTRLQLISGNNKIKYDYKCASSTRPLTCRTDTTPWSGELKGNSIQLIKHNIKCESNEALSQLKLERKGDGNFNYKYTCCKIN